MQTTVKIGICAASTAVMGTGGYFVVSSVLNNEQSVIPKNPKEFIAFNSISTNAKSTGKLYGKYLLDADSNQDGWHDIYKKYFVDLENLPISSTNFDKSVISGHFSNSNESNTKLNQTCKKVYENDAIFNDDTSSDIKVALEDNEGKALGKYCSTFDPKFVSEEEQGTAIKSKGIGQLLSAEKEDNKDLGELKNTDFFKLEEKDIQDEFFKSLLKTKQNTLKNKCKEAYEMNEPGESEELDANKTKFANVLKYCSLKEITKINPKE